MQYNEEWVMARRNRYHGLQPLRNALHHAGDPDDALRIVHIAGTNGKGSTVRFLSDILQAQGYRVGTFTSPHLMHHRDRICINGAWIPQDVFCAYLKEYLDVIEREDLGMFEIDCLIAFSWFAKEQVDYAIIEAGLGGRLDNTNVIKRSELSIIATIGKDHTSVLGERIQQIAFEKAGIIKENGRVLAGTQNSHALAVIRERAKRMHASFVRPKPFYSLSAGMFRYDDDLYTLSYKASYQCENASLALEAARMLGVDIHSACVHEAVSRSTWPGRFEVMQEKPLLILDGAHNEEGIQALVRSLHALPKPRTVVFSALSDKPFLSMCALVSAHCEDVLVTTFLDERAADPHVLAKAGYRYIPDYKKAIAEAEKQSENGTVIVTGSLHFISAVREYILSSGK
ncbi:MAG: bifunctional folylpolyglutamate synthase/dihydrofolate synthase [Solobacterium sp.]|nr:bifunctional folylpolyglutamate synthase/dihydrofolate synthase [Solobacterium sp.]